MNERPSGLFDAIRYRSFDFRSIHSSASYLLHLNFLLITFVSFFFFLRKKRLIRETWKRKNEENAIVDSYRCTTILQKERIYNLWQRLHFNLEIESAYAFIPLYRSPIRRSTGRISRSNEFRWFDSFGNNACYQGTKVDGVSRRKNGLIPGYKSL